MFKELFVMLKFVGMGLNLEVLEGFFMGGVRILGLGGWFFIFFILCFCFFFLLYFGNLGILY